MKKINLKYLHIIVIIIGALFIALPIFNDNMWFDESYTYGIVSKSFADIWSIDSHDVHPILYYYILHIAYLLFGSNIYIYRILSAVPLLLLGILGYTHIRKDFGEKVGILFSFFVFFLPVCSVYSGEIRMYTWAMFFVSAMAIYAYRIFKNPTIKNWALFSVFSLASCYTHYYALITAGIINFLLMLQIIVKLIKQHKEKPEEKMDFTNLKQFIIFAILQVLVYLPWLIVLFGQFGTVSQGFWIQAPSVNLWLETFMFQFTGNLDILFIPKTVAMSFGILILAYTIYSMIMAIIKKKKGNSEEQIKPGILSIGVYILVTLCILIISLVKVPIIYPRYFLNLTGLFIFFLSFFMIKGEKKFITILMCLVTLIVSIYVNVAVIKVNYDESNTMPISYIKQDLEKEDILLFCNEGMGFVLSTKLDGIKSYFYDEQYWNKEEAYKAFGENLITIKKLETLDNYAGRIWIVNGGEKSIYKQMIERYGEEKIQTLKHEHFNTKYHDYQYDLTLIEKSN